MPFKYIPYEERKANQKKNRSKWLLLNKKKYTCKVCNFGTPHTTNFRKHLLTKKHIRNVKKT